MRWLGTCTVGDESGSKVAEAYGVFPKGFPVPDPLVLMSASPELVHLQSQVIRHFMTHSKLDTGLLAMIRFLAANEFDYPFCIQLNGGLLPRNNPVEFSG